MIQLKVLVVIIVICGSIGQTSASQRIQPTSGATDIDLI